MWPVSRHEPLDTTPCLRPFFVIIESDKSDWILTWLFVFSMVIHVSLINLFGISTHCVI